MIIFKKIAAPGKYQDDNAIRDVITYICRADKTPSGIIGGINIECNNAVDSMVAVSTKFGKNSKIRLHHFIISFEKEKAFPPNQWLKIAIDIATHISKEYQVVFAFHEDTEYPHFHFVFNAISYIDGHRYRGGRKDYFDLISCIQNILNSYYLRPLVPVNYRPDNNNPHE